MNLKTILKYSALSLITLMIIGGAYVNHQGKSMYGASTTQVDHTQFEAQEGLFAITNVNILEPNATAFEAPQTIIFENEIIKEIGSEIEIPTNTTIIDGKGKFLIPGLIDAHVHLFKSPNDLLLYIANGVTQIRELIGEEDHLKWRAEIQKGRIGPKMFVASPRLGTFTPMMGKVMEMSQGFKNVPNAEEADMIVQEMYDRGFDGLKIYSHLNHESYLAVAESAKKLGMPIFGHIPFDVEFDDIWHNGQSGIAHFEEIMNALQREYGKYEGDEFEKQFGSFASEEEQFLEYVNHMSNSIADSINKYEISVTSTLWLTQSFERQKADLNLLLSQVELAYENPGISEGSKIFNRALGWLPDVNRYRLNDGISEDQKKGNLKYWKAYGDACALLAKNLAKKQVKIMAGTDANLPLTVPGFSLHDELISLNEAGLTNSQVLQSATINPANWLKSNSGKIEKGLVADLVLLNKNPLENISNTKSINTVIANGKVFNRSLLNEMLASVKSANDISRKVEIEKYTNQRNNQTALNPINAQ